MALCSRCTRKECIVWCSVMNGSVNFFLFLDMGAQVLVWVVSSYVTCVIIYVFISLLALRWLCLTNINMFYVHFHSVTWNFIFLRLPLWHLDYLEVCFLDSMGFGDYLVIFQWLICSLIALWSKDTLYIFSMLLNLLRFVLCSLIWYILAYIPQTLEKDVYAAVVVWSIP